MFLCPFLDQEINILHQNRVLGRSVDDCAYVDLRAKELPPSDGRECHLCSNYANVYAFRTVNGNVPDWSIFSLHLDSLNGTVESVKCIALKNAYELLLCWNELTPTRTRCGLRKYKINAPNYDAIESIVDFTLLQQSLSSLHQLNGKYNNFS